MESYYEINVALDGRHLFATAPRSGVNKQQTEAIYKEIRNRFPTIEGFSVGITYWQSTGRAVTFSSKVGA